ncbi:HWE histidine kinase domain-containing protein [Hyphomicrobium sp.]|uniref:PAS domain-containing sensor histidine kinase n=1 Tax=Hyphomicrobium sp. TaxID=82 RepID=UPI002C4B3407|nr:HWE histidine kinase domain-containing protein [Hyphomicrobium sp.]HRN87551.1 HWE histidine kinase domain-containing protein [Hyphomicrobium sp.]HRQ27060.1 HWE histidine kinase domain-containing protein [Hyphomicrobium sp.]
MDGRPSFLLGGGRAADTIERIDWAATPLGPIGQWPQSLKTALSMMLLSSFPKAIAWGRELITFHNDAFGPILGDKPLAIGRPFSDVWAEVWPEIQPMVKKAFAGEATFIEDFKLTIDRHGYPEDAYFTFCYSPIRAENGEVGGMMDTVMETTGTVLAQRQLAVTNAELSHRMRNALAMVGAIATMSLRHATGLDEARRQLSQRLAALGRTQSFLSGEAAQDAHICELIEQSFAAHPNLRERIAVDGADFRLGSNQALALSLALNELITNSIKYGALSKPEGRIDIRWDFAEFRFVWREVGISGVEVPSREGFGSKVLLQFVPASFSGQARMLYDSDGLIYELEAPAAAIDNA